MSLSQLHAHSDLTVSDKEQFQNYWGYGPVIEVISVYGTQQSRFHPPITRGWKQIQVSKRCVFWVLESRTMDTVQNLSNSECHTHRQNP
jgi:hypothetical protein